MKLLSKLFQLRTLTVFFALLISGWLINLQEFRHESVVWNSGW